MKEWFVNTLFDWIYVLLYDLLTGLLWLVRLVESFFDIFAGTTKISYQGENQFLLNVFFNNSAITNAFWGMTLIALVLAFMFCIYAVARRITDVTGTAKHTLGQIFSNFFKCMLTLLLLNAILIASLNISTVLLDRINYVMINAGVLDKEDGEREFTDAEYGAMARVLATVGNYSVNPSYNSRYNINSCFNAIRGDLYSLQASGVFDYEYPQTSSRDHCWQSALALLASSADLTKELSLDEYNSSVAAAFETVVYQLKANPNFVPVKSVASISSVAAGNMKTDVLLFLVAGSEAANNAQYNTGDIFDNLRIGYFNGNKDYNDIDQVRKDFDIWKFNYIVAYLVSIVFILIMAICIFNLIVRIFNLLLLYVTAPLFVSSMPLDEGSKFQSWIQAFVIQMFSGFGMVVAMRLYLMLVPVIMSSDLIFFEGSGTWYAILNLIGRVLLILGGAWAVLKSSSLISGILSGSPGMAALQQEGQTSSLITRGARTALRQSAHLAGGLISGVAGVVGSLPTAPAKAISAMQNWRRGIADSYHQIGDSHRARKQERADRAASKAKYDAEDDASDTGAKSSGSASENTSADAPPERNRATTPTPFEIPDYPKPPPLPPDDPPAPRANQDAAANIPPAPNPPYPPPPPPPPLPRQDRGNQKRDNGKDA